MARKERSPITINFLSNNKVEIGGKSDLSDVVILFIVLSLILATPSPGASSFVQILLRVLATSIIRRFIFYSRLEVKILKPIFSHCHLYGLKSKKNLARVLKIPSPKFFDQRFLATQVNPFLMNGVRLIEAPSYELKKIQTRIKVSLDHIRIPEYVFSGIKGRSYVDHAKLHKGKKFVYAIDISAFFPSISREKVYSFFRSDLNTSPDVADILTSLTTIDLSLTGTEEMEEIEAFLRSKKVNTLNHLISGSPASPIMSYLANLDMINELHSYSSKNGLFMTVYVDDIVFSSDEFISNRVTNRICDIVSKYRYRVSTSKRRLYVNDYPKRITGVIIDKEGSLAIPNRLRQNIMIELERCQLHSDNGYSKKRLLGLVASARQIDPNAFPSIYSYARSRPH